MDLGDSKSTKLLYIGFGIGLTLIILGMSIKVFFGENVIEYVLAGIGLTGGNGALATLRSLLVDAPIRQSYASLDVAKQAQEAGVTAVSLPDTRNLHVQTIMPPPAPAKQGDVM